MEEQQTTNCLGTESDDLSRYLARATEARIPLAVSFELTRRCSFRCVHCYLGDQAAIRLYRDQELDTDRVMSLLDEFVEAGTLFLTLTGGDPMLRPDFVRIYEHAVCSGLLVSVYCNGSLVTDAVIRSFIRYPPRVVEITLYGATEKTFEAIAQKPGAFAACMEGIVRLRNAGVRLRLKTMAMTLNREELAAMRELAEELGVSFRHDCSLISVLPNEDNSGFSNTCENGEHSLKETLRFRLSPEEAVAADFSSAKVSEALRKTAGAKTSSDEFSRKLFSCGAGRYSCHITPYGRVQPCIISLHPYADTATGQHFQDAWDMISRDVTAQEVQDGFLCTNCQYKGLCTGCPSAFLLETGDAQKPASFYCNYAACRKQQALLT